MATYAQGMGGNVATESLRVHLFMDFRPETPEWLRSSQVRKGEGTIINMGSMSAVRPTPAQCVYSACKWGLRGWSLGCQEALRHHGVKVMLINPGAGRCQGLQGSCVRLASPQPSIPGALMLSVNL